MPRPQFTLRALLVAMLVVAIGTLPTVRLVTAVRAWFAEKPAVLPPPEIGFLHLDRSADIETSSGNGGVHIQIQEDKMPIIPFGREPDESIEL